MNPINIDKILCHLDWDEPDDPGCSTLRKIIVEILEIPVEDLPLHLNDNDELRRDIVRLRLEQGL